MCTKRTTEVRIFEPESSGTQLSYTHSNEILSIDLNTTYTEGDEVRVVVAYHGRPQNSPYGSFGFSTHNNEPIIGTLSEPYGARAWWPCKDVNTDKADSVDIRVTVPNDLIVASNGTLRAKTIEGDYTTYWWHEQYPIATYLVSIAIHPYIVYYNDRLFNRQGRKDNTHVILKGSSSGIFFKKITCCRLK